MAVSEQIPALRARGVLVDNLDTQAETPDEVTWSGKIVFTREFDDLWIVDSETEQGQRLTDDGLINQGPKWSPDGSRVAYYASSAGGRAEVYVIDADGQNRVNITSHSADDRMPCWSPDGRSIAFASDRGGNRDIYVMDLSNGEVTDLTSDNAGVDNAPAWSPDGSLIAFSSERLSLTGDREFAIYVVPVVGGEARRLIPDSGLSESYPAWSPDGRQIAFDTSASGSGPDIYVYSLYDSSLVNVTHSPSFFTKPTWSQDGTQIAAAVWADDWQIVVIDLASETPPIQVTPRGSNDDAPSWY